MRKLLSVCFLLISCGELPDREGECARFCAGRGPRRGYVYDLDGHGGAACTCVAPEREGK